MPNSPERTKETITNLKKARNNLKQMDRDMFLWEQEQKRINLKKLKNRIAARKRRNLLKKKKPPPTIKKEPIAAALPATRRPKRPKAMISSSGKFTLLVKPGFKVTSVRVLKRRLIISATKDKKK